MPKKDRAQQPSNRDVPMPTEGETICVVKKMLGGDHLIVLCMDGKERLARIPGKIRKKVWMKEGDVVLVGIWDFQPNRCDIVHRYENDEIKRLINEGVISREVIDQLRG
ncbi:translation initiation factor eIF-1A [Sulfolobus sp. A20]|uniref:translation initiation factor aIF-1A n=1 Tax=Sulfolobaceae TaxID=118883 RepID=UPI0008460B4B|nr:MULTISPECIES: translation initiation factor aIF-1A [unclassified Sulfolobus]TRM74694.1 translation initiation factor eIF-1A [Sulfolobus sp. E5]TRM78447.1 translation initiation factor eIF-1A [Sulfolobus sp. A20-N-F8]TRM80861.1 translation initiation factor eIF-1A [Sulfolobus sp. D5]TRM82698.1 translation initiation factor eIF-1A [Sulfolobus sp. A20-N-F6]TRM87919.1 translation initiation factor eIF-1A [Sulfolobus sp. E3]TRM89202.1 translation initiation factor eIF-1A [Sulfolobus sp. C3]TRM